jgi:multiple antibiotic resistance protein
MINPFALFIYLEPVMKDLSHRDFITVLFKASLISFGIFSLFILGGEFLFEKMFQISFESFRMFVGVVIFSFAYMYIVKGYKAFMAMKENLDDLASEIALPFMVGAGSISVAIVMSYNYSLVFSFGMLVFVMIANFGIILGLKYIKDQISKRKFRVAFDKNMQILMRLNGFFIGAIGIDMMITGIKNLFFQ